MDQLNKVLIFMAIFLFVLYIIGHMIGKLIKADKSMENTFTNTVMFYNSGNYGIPLISLAFNNNAMAVAIQVIVMVIQNVTNFTLGAFQANDKGGSLIDNLKGVAKLPYIYALFLAIILRLLNLEVYKPIMVSLNYLSQAMIAVALLTLGVKLDSTKLDFEWNVLLSNIVRLVGAPIVAFIIIKLLGFHGILAQVLFISSGLPTAVNTVVLSLEYNSQPEFASKVVFNATLLSAITETVLIYIAQNFIL